MKNGKAMNYNFKIIVRCIIDNLFFANLFEAQFYFVIESPNDKNVRHKDLVMVLNI